MNKMPSALDEYGIKWLYYFFLFDNLLSIIENGILPKNIVDAKIQRYSSFANEDVQTRRHVKKIKFSCNKDICIHDSVPLYFTPYTPTLYAVREKLDDICFAVVDASILFQPGISFALSDGNAGSLNTKFFPSLEEGLSRLPWNVIKARYWNDFEDGVRKRNSECLIYPKISTEKIKWFIVCTDENKQHIEDILDLYGTKRIKVRNSPDLSSFLKKN
jgi:hypothetical protein